MMKMKKFQIYVNIGILTRIRWSEIMVLELNVLMKTMINQWWCQLLNRQSLDSTYDTANMFYLNTLAPLNTNMTLKLINGPHAQAAITYYYLCDEAWNKTTICKFHKKKKTYFFNKFPSFFRLIYRNCSVFLLFLY